MLELFGRKLVGMLIKLPFMMMLLWTFDMKWEDNNLRIYNVNIWQMMWHNITHDVDLVNHV